MPQNNIQDWPGLTYAELRREEERVLNRSDSVLNQGRLGTCGPIAVLHALEVESPTRLKALADEVYRDHALLPADVVEGANCERDRHPLAVILATHLLNENNLFLTYHATESKADLVAGGSTSSDIKKWLEKFFPNREVSSYSSYFWGALNNAQKVSALWVSPEKKPIVVALLNGDYLQAHAQNKHLPSLLAACSAKGHVIHILTPFIECLDGSIRFDAYTWGATQTFRMSKDDFKGMMWELIVAQ
ncbi:MAG: hypothetical protein WCK42_04115 [Myxococcaceae bacterium]